jgi:predicted RNA-binding Zn ribbon-like protein
MPNKDHPAVQPAPILLADAPALDLLNTLPKVNGQLIDFFQNDADVLHWMRQAGFDPERTRPGLPPSGLRHAAQTLRESFCRLVEGRKAGERANLSALNAFLAEAQSYPQLVWDKSQSLTIKRIRQQRTSEQILAPLAEAAADLLVTADFDLIKRCEDQSCVLWFYDRTKSHHRRWCNMATCGNRHKVAAYRKRRMATPDRHPA